MRAAAGLPGDRLPVRGAEAARRGDRPRRRGAALGTKALAAPGDYLLENDPLRVVLDAPDHPHHLAPSGGAILDLAASTQSSERYTDGTNAIYHAAGVLPRDAVHYESLVLDPRIDLPAADAYVAVIFRGHLEGERRRSPSSPATSSAPASRACASAPISTTAPPIRTRSSWPTGSSGATTTLVAVRAGARDWGSSRPTSICCTSTPPGASGRSRSALAVGARYVVRGRLLRSRPGGGVQQHDADRGRRARWASRSPATGSTSSASSWPTPGLGRGARGRGGDARPQRWSTAIPRP